MKFFTLLIPLSLYAINLSAQKPVLDSGLVWTYQYWPSVEDGELSRNGQYTVYRINSLPAGKNTFVAKSTFGDWEQRYEGVEEVRITHDSRRMIFLGPGDSLWMIMLGGYERKLIATGVVSYEMSGDSSQEWVAYRIDTGMLVLQSLESSDKRQWGKVKAYQFNRQGTALVFQETIKDTNGAHTRLKWADLLSEKTASIWEGDKVLHWVFDKGGNQLAFIVEAKSVNGSGRELRYYRRNMDSAIQLANMSSIGVDSGLLIATTAPVFSRTGDRIFFQLVEQPSPPPLASNVKVDIWHYKQSLQSEQLKDLSPRLFWAMMPVSGNRVIRLQQEGERIIFGHTGPDSNAIILKTNGPLEGWKIQLDHSVDLYWISMVTASRQLIKRALTYLPLQEEFYFSPDGRWILWYNRMLMKWFSYEIGKDQLQSICRDIPYPVYNEKNPEFVNLLVNSFVEPLGIGAWVDREGEVLIYDDYDIWKVDLTARRQPVNITRGYGRQHHLKFRIAWEKNQKLEKDEKYLSERDSLLLCGFDSQTKQNGFYRGLVKGGRPAELSKGSYVMYIVNSQLKNYSDAGEDFLIKAREAQRWLVRRRSAIEAPNYFTTDDFKQFKPVSDLQPQRVYNWLTTELVHWRMLDGQRGAGILYKPENFDAKKKYPVILHYYEKMSDDLNDYLTPRLCYADISIPYFVSRGYLVFLPDIHYRMGRPGASAFNAVVSAAKHLATLSFVDCKHMGIQGHSFGGFETNYLITHTQLFAAAVSAAGISDLISFYGGLRFGINGYGGSGQSYFEGSQGRLGSTLWQRPDLYLDNSPILRADRVTTPLLIMQNRQDASNPFVQGVEMFTALRRLGKRVWMLQYDNGDHVVGMEEDARDYSRRLLQFFDHYLKGTPPAIWMTEGVPARMKGLKTGFELDISGKVP